MEAVNALLARVGGWKSVVFAVVAVAVIVVLKRLLTAPKVDPNLRYVVCACGWKGTVSKYKPRCPKCARSDSMQDA